MTPEPPEPTEPNDPNDGLSRAETSARTDPSESPETLHSMETLEYRPSARSSLLEVGATVEGRYRVERLLGVGGMGAVYAVRDPAGAELALKVAHNPADEVMCKRFAREAEAARALKSEHVARVFGSGVMPDGSPYMVMELLSGQDLHDYLREHGPLEPREALDIVAQIAEALGEAHELGMVHRDVKPANMFVKRGADGRLRAKLIDFGVSKNALTTLPPVTQLTQTGTVLGSPHYMSPEQLVSSSDVDVRADVWSLGVSAYEMLTGKPPFPGGSVAEVVSAVLRDRPRPLRELAPAVPRGLEQVVLRCLEKDRADRIGSMQALRDALAATALPAATASTGSLRSTSSATRWAPPTRPGGARATATGAQPAATPPSRRWLAAVGALALIGVVFTVVMLERRGGADDAELAPSGELGRADRELEAAVRDQLVGQVHEAFSKFEARQFDAAERLAVEVEEGLLERGLTPGTSSSRIAQDAAIVQARVSAARAIEAVRHAKRDDDPAAIMARVKQHLAEEAEHAERATAWDPQAPRCIRSAPLLTQAAVLEAWRGYAGRVAPPRRRVAENHTAALVLALRTDFDKHLAPSSELSDACREAVRRARAHLAADASVP